ncbi:MULTISPECIES: Rv3235 family protein [Actinoalloteichus]|uniref:Uncharacterized protein n=1 Tax=Actinoalloteichus fjordicus TaxID=1612552 RepID=A0AAC9LGS0_9PSEU|nr:MULTISPECIES: Rv3235 family protein [Actinoalloteichus]APU17307.1 hypothetical protein UA74_26510 [Actinoalloteichus fjordicus]APU23390.1 hypothetical protein UA75_27095 [Actinoalloteichus sp. GBA129-24]
MTSLLSPTAADAGVIAAMPVVEPLDRPAFAGLTVSLLLAGASAVRSPAAPLAACPSSERPSSVESPSSIERPSSIAPDPPLHGSPQRAAPPSATLPRSPRPARSRITVPSVAAPLASVPVEVVAVPDWARLSPPLPVSSSPTSQVPIPVLRRLATARSNAEQRHPMAGTDIPASTTSPDPPGRTPSAHRIARQALHALVEILDGRRSRLQLGRLLVPDLHYLIAPRARHGPSTNPPSRLLRVHAQQVSETVIESTAPVRGRDRVFAVALRLELRGTRWLGTALQVLRPPRSDRRGLTERRGG